MDPDKQNVNHLSYRKLLIEEIIMFPVFGGQSQSTGPNPDTTKANLIRLTERHFINYHQRKTKLKLKENAFAARNVAFAIKTHVFGAPRVV